MSDPVKVLLPPPDMVMPTLMPWLVQQATPQTYIVETYKDGCNNFEAKAQDAILRALRDDDVLAGSGPSAHTPQVPCVHRVCVHLTSGVRFAGMKLL